MTVDNPVFLDFDGTIADSSHRHYAVYEESIRQIGGKAIPRDEYWAAKRKDTSWTQILQQSTVDQSLNINFMKVFQHLIELPEMLELDELLPDAMDALSQMSDKSTLVLVSLRRNRSVLEKQIENLGISEYFDSVLTGHSDSKRGTLSKKAEVIRAEWGTPIGGSIIGDTEADISAGKLLGLRTIAVTSGIRDKSFLASQSPDFIVKDLDEARRVFF